MLEQFKRMFSPRMRGCSVPKLFPFFQAVVFPAYAGMFLENSGSIGASLCFPRVCGDVPQFSSS